MLNISKKNQLPKTHDQLSDLIITKNTPIRNYSTSTRNSRVSYSKQSQNQSEDKITTNRTFSVNDGSELPQISKTTNVILKRPQFLPRPKQQVKRLMHVQTSPTNLEPDNKQEQINNQSNHIQFEQIDVSIEAQEVYIQYIGFRSLSQFNKILIITYDLLFGEWNTQYFGKQNQSSKPQVIKQLIMKMRTESILLLQLSQNQKLNSLHNTQIDWFDCIYSIRCYNPKEMLSYQLNKNNLWINISKLQQQLKVNHKINNFYFVDLIFFTQPEIFEQDDFINKILYVDDTQSRLFHLYITNPVNLSLLYKNLQTLIKSNSVIDLCRLSIKHMIDRSVMELQTIQLRVRQLRYMEELKQKAKQHFKKVNLQKTQLCPEQRAERMRDQMVDEIKRKQHKITNMHFIVGDTIMRNIDMFRNHENDKFYKHFETIQLIDNLSKQNTSATQNYGSYANYAFYCL